MDNIPHTPPPLSTTESISAVPARPVGFQDLPFEIAESIFDLLVPHNATDGDGEREDEDEGAAIGGDDGRWADLAVMAQTCRFALRCAVPRLYPMMGWTTRPGRQ
jgi:hypothetical protein